MIEQIKALCEKQEEVRKGIIELAPQLFEYFEVIFRDKFRGWKNEEFDNDVEKIELLSGGILYEYEYKNIEYETYELILTFEDMALTPQELEIKLEERYQQEKAEYKKQQDEKKKTEKKAFEAGERKLYESLKKKFGEQK